MSSILDIHGKRSAEDVDGGEMKRILKQTADVSKSSTGDIDKQPGYDEESTVTNESINGNSLLQESFLKGSAKSVTRNSGAGDVFSIVKPLTTEEKPRATFGALLFTMAPIFPAKSLGLTDVTKTNTGPVFGALSQAVGGKVEQTLKIDDKHNKKSTGDSTAPITGLVPIFGSGSRFGLALKDSLKKRSFLDESNPPAIPAPSDSISRPELFKQVDLAPLSKITTGEENENVIFTSQAKLFELDLTNIADGWKERGKGSLHLNQERSDTSRVRIVMRSQGLLRVVLNYRISADTKIMKGYDSSLHPGKFLRFNGISAEGKPVQYLLKFGTDTIRDLLASHIDKIVLRLQTPKKESQESSICQSSPLSKTSSLSSS